LSRSEKKILHIDENDYYGGAEAAFSLQEAEEWAKRMNDGKISWLAACWRVLTWFRLIECCLLQHHGH
jgi:RAB protein geranylgeranyltransferase component A